MGIFENLSRVSLVSLSEQQACDTKLSPMEHAIKTATRALITFEIGRFKLGAEQRHSCLIAARPSSEIVGPTTDASLTRPAVRRIPHRLFTSAPIPGARSVIDVKRADLSKTSPK